MHTNRYGDNKAIKILTNSNTKLDNHSREHNNAFHKAELIYFVISSLQRK
jgi:hypothetical protein